MLAAIGAIAAVRPAAGAAASAVPVDVLTVETNYGSEVYGVGRSGVDLFPRQDEYGVPYLNARGSGLHPEGYWRSDSISFAPPTGQALAPGTYPTRPRPDAQQPASSRRTGTAAPVPGP